MSFSNNRCFTIVSLIISTAFIIIMFVSDASAMEKAGTGRKIWDNILLWINFGILVFLFMKFAKKPLMDFLSGERKKIEKRINSADEETEKAKSQMNAEEGRLKNIDERIQKTRETIIESGKREREQIIQKAKISAEMMIADAQKEVQHRIEVAKKSFGEEMLDLATSMAAQKIIKEMSTEDNERIIDSFAGGLGAMKGNTG